MSNLTYTTKITVSAEFRALHRWEACPYNDVAFLKDWHRHIFKVQLCVGVSHADRHVEFFQLQEQLRHEVSGWEGQKIDMSCEMFAESLMVEFVIDGYHVISVTVSEDGENSATVEPINLTPLTPQSIPLVGLPQFYLG